MKLMKTQGKNQFMLLESSRLYARGTVLELLPIAMRWVEERGIHSELLKTELWQIGFPEESLIEYFSTSTQPVPKV